MQKHSVDFKVSAVLRLTEVREVKSVMPITASVGENGLATALTMIKSEVWKQSSIAPAYQSFLLPFFVAV